MARSYKSSRAALLVIAYYAARYKSDKLNDYFYGGDELSCHIQTSALFIKMAFTELAKYGYLEQSISKDEDGYLKYHYCPTGKGAVLIENYTDISDGYISVVDDDDDESKDTAIYNVLQRVNLEEFEQFLNNDL